MKKYIIAILCVLIFSVAYAECKCGKSITYPAICTNIVDGDTIDLEINLGFGMLLKDRARFLGFDAPETFRPENAKEKIRGLAAKKFLKDMIENKHITIAVPIHNYRGSFGRILVVPYYDDKNIIDIMKEQGFEK